MAVTSKCITVAVFLLTNSKFAALQTLPDYRKLHTSSPKKLSVAVTGEVQGILHSNHSTSLFSCFLSWKPCKAVKLDSATSEISNQKEPIKGRGR